MGGDAVKPFLVGSEVDARRRVEGGVVVVGIEAGTRVLGLGLPRRVSVRAAEVGSTECYFQTLRHGHVEVLGYRE